MNYPIISLNNHNEVLINTQDWQEKLVVFYFYPKDNTSGCTTQAQEFASLMPKFHEKNCTIIGISPDSSASHKKFAEKYHLNFELLADTDKKFSELMGVWVEKSMYGRKYYGIERSSFIYYQGKLVQSWRKVKAAGHAEIIYQAIKNIRS